VTQVNLVGDIVALFFHPPSCLRGSNARLTGQKPSSIADLDAPASEDIIVAAAGACCVNLILDGAISLTRIRTYMVYASLACSSLLAPGAIAETAPDVRTLMTAEEFKEAGLERLSPSELEALNRWLGHYSVRQASELRPHSEFVKEEVRKVEQEGIRTRIAGEFNGWDGHTVFRLENGQVWQQRQPDKWHYSATSPEVELSRNFMGFWMLRVLDADRSVGVTRID
jgi:hypothetical protein